MEKWYVAAKKADFDKWAKEFHISPVTARILRNRDLTEESEIQRFLYGKLEDCYSPWLLKDMDKAAEEILKAVREGLHIRVIGDYDVDGICSSYILTKGFQMLGAQVDTAIPHRIHDGYGLNEHLIEEAKREGVGMIVTCDNGIAAAPQIAMANSLGMRVIVTDHHEVPYIIEENGERKEQLPPALAVVDVSFFRHLWWRGSTETDPGDHGKDRKSGTCKYSGGVTGICSTVYRMRCYGVKR